MLRLRSSRPGDVLVDHGGDRRRVEEALLRARVSGERASRAKGCSGPRNQAATGSANPRLRPAIVSRGSSGAIARRKSRFLERPRTLCRRGQRQRQLGDDGVEEGDPRLERVGHARPVDLDQDVVDQVGADVDVLHAAELLGALGLLVAARGARERVGVRPRAAAPAARPAPRARRPGSRRRGGRPGPGASPAAKRFRRSSRRRLRRCSAAGRRAGAGGSRCGPKRGRHRVADVPVVAAEELVAALPREHHLDVLARPARRPGRSAARSCRRRARRRPRPSVGSSS